MGEIIDMAEYTQAKGLVIRTGRDLDAVSTPMKMPAVEFSPRNIKLHTYEPPVDPITNFWDRAVVDPLTLRGYTAMRDQDREELERDEDEMLSADELGLDDTAELELVGIDELLEDGDLEDGEAAALNEPMTLPGFISSLQEFLSRLPDAKRGNIFMNDVGDGVCLNILVGIAFAESDSKVKQVNLIIAPTDRSLLDSVGTSINDSVDALENEGGLLVPAVGDLDEMGKEELRQACREAGVKYGKLNNDGMRDALRMARELIESGF